ncbi:hypothetical protein BJ742DRAFT_859970 [Cladochytrium replicatum]|nr:hypothetical protein BJ742DRAFT_859970 [Cladochytrium replicatum]
MPFFPWYPCAVSMLSQTMIVNWGICTIGRVIYLREMFNFHRQLITQYDAFDRIVQGTSELNAQTQTWNRIIGPRSRDARNLFRVRHGIRTWALRKAWTFVGTLWFINTTMSLIIIFSVPGLVADDFFAPMGPDVVAGALGKTRRGVDCQMQDWWYWPGFGLMCVFAGLAAPISMWSMRNIRDTYGFRLELLITFCVAIPCYTLYFLFVLVYWNYEGGFTPNVLLYFYFLAGHGSVLFPLVQVFRQKLDAKRLALNMESFERVLSDPVMFASLKELTASDFCSEQTIFLEEVWSLKAKVLGERGRMHRPYTNNLGSITMFVESSDSLELYPIPSRAMQPNKLDENPITSYTTSDIRTDNFVVPKALVPQFVSICEVFIRPGAPMELNLSAAVRRQCVESIGSQSFPVNVYDAAMDQVIQSLAIFEYLSEITPTLILNSFDDNPL